MLNKLINMCLKLLLMMAIVLNLWLLDFATGEIKVNQAELKIIRAQLNEQMQKRINP